MDLVITLNFVLYCIILGIVAFFFIVCLYQRIRNYRDLPWLTAALFSAIISYGSLAMFYFLQGIGQKVDNWVIHSLSSFNWTFYFLFLHYASLVSLNPTNLGRHSLVLGITVGATIVNIVWLLGYYQNTSIMLFYLICSSLGVLAFSIAFPIVWKNSKTETVRDRGTIWDICAVLILLIGTALYTCVNIACLLIPELLPSYPTYGSIAGGITLIGVIVIMINYVINNYIYRIPYPLVFVSLYTEGGTLLYSRHFHPVQGENPDVQEELIVKLFSAVHSFTREIVQSGSQLKLIKTRNYHIIFTQVYSKIIFSVAASNATFYLQRSIHRFIALLTQDLLKNLLEKGDFQSDHESSRNQLDLLLYKTFPYLRMPKEVPVKVPLAQEVPH